jgi:hypothetical protein
VVLFICSEEASFVTGRRRQFVDESRFSAGFTSPQVATDLNFQQSQKNQVGA